MPEEPSYSAIVNTPVNDTIGSGTPAVVIDNSENSRLLNQQAQFKADNDWRKYNNFLQNFKDISKDQNAIAALPVATPDREILQKQMADIMGEIAKDPKSALGGKGLFDIQQKLGKLTSDAYESKANNAFDLAHRKFILANPSFNTDENKATIESYLPDQPLGARKPYMLDAAPKFDMGAFVKNGLALPGVKTPYANAGLTPDKQNIFNESGEIWNPEPFDRYFKGGLQHPDVRKAAENMYNQLPADQKKAYDNNGGLPAFWEDQRKIYSPPAGTNILKRDLKGNPEYGKDAALAEKTANDKANRAIEWAKINIEKDKIKGAGADDLVNAKSVLDEATSIINKAEPVPVDIGDGKTETRYRISDPTLLAKFANIDKEGKTTNPPDVLEYDKATDQVKLIYYKGKTDSGKNIIDKEVPLDQRTWLKTITQRSFPGKDVGKVNTLIESALNKNDNSLFKISQSNNTVSTQQAANAKSAASSVISAYPIDIQTRIRAFAVANKLSEDEAIQELKKAKRIK